MTDGAFTFVSWVRRGLATAINTADLASSSQTIVTLTFDTDAGPENSSTTLDLVGPGDITGLDPSVIVRTWPKADDLDAEFVAYPLIEFDQADLPWRYSPEPSPDPTPQLRAWFSLIVLKSDECTLAPPTPEQPLAVLTVTQAEFLQPPADLWAWAHTQFEGESLDPSSIEGRAALLERIKGDPGLFTARALSPRLLLPNTDYVACLVPTFERGRLIGLGEIDPSDVNPPVRQLWAAANNLRLPVYFSFRFRTGTIGNFEHAARLIKPFVLPASVGRRDMDVQKPGFELPPAASGSLPVEGALMSVAAAEAGPPPWPTAERNEFIDALKALVNSAGHQPIDDPTILPPLYGQWYAATDELDDPGNSPVWFHDLNSDPRTRVAAGLGTQVIQREQQALLASGWDQVEEIQSVNQQFRVLQLARGAIGSLFRRHLQPLDRERLYQVTLRLHAFVTCGDGTVCGHIFESPIDPGFFSSQWLRFTRKRGAIGRFQGRPGLGAFSSLLDQLAQCRKPAPEPADPPVHQPADPRGRIPCEFVDELLALGSTKLLFWGLVILWTARKLLVSQSGDCWWMALKALRYAIALIELAISGADVRRRCKWLGHTLAVADVQNAPPMPLATFFGALPSPLPFPTLPGPPGVDSSQASEVRAALIRLLNFLEFTPALLCPPDMELEECSEQLRTQLVPELTVGDRLKDRVHRNFPWDAFDALEPMFPAPEYERPMYLPLSEISSEWILPGLNGVGRNAISLAVTNQRFIEAYMTGLNQEMTRELLWNEFPTDQRGTYFRQFWDIAATILEDGSKLPAEQLRDIKPFRLWEKNRGLGFHSPRLPDGDGGTAELLVLVVRAELVRKYPNVIVYAQKVVANRLTGEQRRPVFYALINPDTAFYGFDMTVEEIEADSSWYFVLQEQPGDPKFQDEQTMPVESRSDSTRYSTPGGALGDSAGAIAESTFAQPFRIGFQAQSMLPTGS